MIPVLSSQRLKNLDEIIAKSNPELSFEMMNRAARSIFDLIISKYLDLQKQNIISKITILCGSGNNGGDGILLANYLLEQDYPVQVFLLALPENLSPNAQLAYQKLSKYNSPLIFIINENDVSFLKDYYDSCENYHLILVDALLGLGFKDDLRPLYRAVIQESQKISNSTIIAVDLPSGLNPDDGHCQNFPISSSITVSMGFPKLGSFFYPARAFYGFTVIADLPYPENLVKEFDEKIFFVDSVRGFLPPRIINGHKYNHGALTLIAGTKSMRGAAALASIAAYRSGLGMVYLANEDEESCPILEAVQVNIHDSEFFKKSLSRSHVICIGPGLSDTAKNFVKKILKTSPKPVILDADAINLDSLNLVKKYHNPVLITPHEGEYSRLFPSDLYPNISAIDLVNILKKRAQEYNIHILFKGNPNILVSSQGEAFILPYGNSSLASAGSGDVLAGIIAGFAAQAYANYNFTPSYDKLLVSTMLAVYVHGKASEQASLELSEYSVIASDLVNYLPKIITNL